MPELTISIADTTDPQQLLRSLYDEILVDDELRPAEKALVSAQPDPSKMGAGEIIQMVLTDPVFIGGLTTCITAWLATHRTKLSLVFHGPAGKTEVSVDAGTSLGKKTIREALERALDGNAPAGQ
ncbi:hypothetical protein ACFWU5_06480 [Nocardia sp. NPDC058640]|uniref:effector-associated constant component EACC1 n=1 Tax=Nocardia sp. NPDC058640 TaxID=3346571 RepID=UPI0036477223